MGLISHHNGIVQVWIMILKKRLRNQRIMIGKNALKALDKQIVLESIVAREENIKIMLFLWY